MRQRWKAVAWAGLGAVIFGMVACSRPAAGTARGQGRKRLSLLSSVYHPPFSYTFGTGTSVTFTSATNGNISVTHGTGGSDVPGTGTVAGGSSTPTGGTYTCSIPNSSAWVDIHFSDGAVKRVKMPL